MTKPWDPNVQLGVFADETQAFLMAEILEMVKPFYKRAGLEDFCTQKIAEFKQLGTFLNEANAEGDKNKPEPKPELEPELDPEEHHSPGPGDFTHGCCGTLPASLGELLVLSLATGFLTKEQEEGFGEEKRDSLSDLEEFMGYDVMVALHNMPDDADFKDSDKYWALQDIYDEEHPGNAEERERANEECQRDREEYERLLRGEESTPEEAEEDTDEDEY
ncbi:hypothetical protein [Faecalibaculum rodentium]|uniref:hypothetical protein n=1 Tax=Faecalibaculum rodentium TaxID=1702221 RepID=UPI0023F5473B|nr:hypothetical protein [Faecalibaculum rodentium]